jgi:glucan biosynthesis protein C
MSNTSSRIHGLDALRGILMMLGIVLHAGTYAQPLTDNQSVKDHIGLTMDGIHLFRMPAFFLISGFFGALLWHRRGAKALFKNRFERIVLPLIGSVVVLWPVIVFSGGFQRAVSHRAISPGTLAFEGAAGKLFPPESLFHLWFLYDLVLISLTVGVAVLIMNRLSFSWPWLLARVRITATGPWRSVVVFGLLNWLWFALLGWNEIPTSVGWIPEPNIVFYYLMIYSLGWMLFASKIDLSSFKERAWTLFVLAAVGLVIRGISYNLFLKDSVSRAGFFQSWQHALGTLLHVGTGCFVAVATTRALLGLFLRYAASGRPFWRYISDSAYCVYLLHMPLTMIVSALLVDWNLPALIHWYLSILLVTGICLAIYDAAVRSSAVGRFLNGRCYPSFSRPRSALVSLVVLGFLGYSMFKTVPRAEWKSPWVHEKAPHELLDPSGFTAVNAETIFPGVELRRCVGVGRYVVCPDPTPYAKIAGACTALGGSPLILDDEAEALAIGEWLPKLLGRPSWLAATDVEEEGVWRWSDGTVVGEETVWSEGEPNDWGGEDCAVQYWSGADKSNDVGCENFFAFLCELNEEARNERLPAISSHHRHPSRDATVVTSREITRAQRQRAPYRGQSHRRKRRDRVDSGGSVRPSP